MEKPVSSRAGAFLNGLNAMASTLPSASLNMVKEKEHNFHFGYDLYTGEPLTGLDAENANSAKNGKQERSSFNETDATLQMMRQYQGTKEYYDFIGEVEEWVDEEKGKGEGYKLIKKLEKLL